LLTTTRKVLLDESTLKRSEANTSTQEQRGITAEWEKECQISNKEENNATDKVSSLTFWVVFAK